MSLQIKARTKQPEIRKDQLLDAAEELFARKGPVDTTVADIAEAAGVAKGTFYLYFPSKDHCVAALKKRLAEGLVDRFLAVLAPAYDQMARGEKDLDVAVVTRHLLDVSFAYAVEHSDTHRALFHTGDTIEVDQVALEAEEAITSCLTQAFNMMIQLGLTELRHPEQTARILFAGVHWALEGCLRTQASPDALNALKEAAVELVTRTLAPAT